MFVVVGLGNPGAEYEKTRHNAGRMVVERFLKDEGFPALVETAKYNALVSEGRMGRHKVTVLLPETFMNASGGAVKKLVTDQKKAEKLVVVYDDIDLPLGSMKLSFGRGSGGHNGVASIMKAVRTKDFVRVRVGVAPTTPSGKLKKPKGEQKVLDFLMGAFKEQELVILKKVGKKASAAISTLIEEGRERAMNEYN